MGDTTTERSGGTAYAPGWPGISPTWSSSDKDFVTTSLGSSHLWATIGHGVLNEVYCPNTGTPQLRDVAFGLLRPEGFVDLKRIRRYRLQTPAPHVPLLTVIHEDEGYTVTLEFLPDPDRNALLVRYAVEGGDLVLLAAPRLSGTGYANTAYTKGARLHAAGPHGGVLGIMADTPFTEVNAGFVGASDGWRQLVEDGRLTETFDRAENGNVALTAVTAARAGVIAITFAGSEAGTQTLARSCFADGFDAVRETFVAGWEAWGSALTITHPDADIERAARLAVTVLKIHEDTTFPGAAVASLSVPWGNTSDNSGGYHLVWPRDTCLSAFALIAAGQTEDARRILNHLIATQTDGGGWAQCAHPNGEPYWVGEQLDEIAFPVMLAAKLREMGERELIGTGDMVRRAVARLLRTGPITPQDRWEENSGFSPFALAAHIAALVSAAPWLEADERAEAEDAADELNARLSAWCVADGDAPYYVRIGPPAHDGGMAGGVQIRNRWDVTVPARDLLGLDYSYLVRLGLRRGDDPVVAETTERVDARLRVELPCGPLFHRYNEDGYGEHPDGSAFDGSGIGRAWPLLAGERGHLALAADEDPLPYLKAMVASASAGGMMPEQVWDTDAIPGRELFPGRPSGSAMPLVWTHAEFIKLVLASASGTPVEQLAAVVARYGGAAPAPKAWRWRPDVPVGTLPAGTALMFQDTRPFTIRYGFDGWRDPRDSESVPGAFGLHVVRLEPADLAGHGSIEFTRRHGEDWAGQDWSARLA